MKPTSMREIICVILGLGIISLAISTQGTVQHVPLGNKVTIPCDGYGDRRTGNWLHRNNDSGFTTVVHELLGYTFKSKNWSNRVKTARNFSLEISPFTELDKGTYVCRVCKLEKCTDGKPITLLPQIALHTLFVIAGDQFRYSCSYTLTQKADWRFEPIKEKNTAMSANHKLSNTSAFIISDVQPNNAGKYSYWGEIYTGQQHRICSINLCVLSVITENLNASPQKCTLYCDVDISINDGGLSVLRTDKWNISITGSMNKPKSSLTCRLLSSGVETQTFSTEDTTATAQSYVISSVTADHSRHSPVSAILGMCIGFLFIVVMALIILFYSLRQRADRNSSRSAIGHSEEETEFQVIYSTLQVGAYKQQNSITPYTECVYSQVCVSNNI